MKKVILSQLILITSILISCTDKLENTEVNNNPTNQVVLTSNEYASIAYDNPKELSEDEITNVIYDFKRINSEFKKQFITTKEDKPKISIINKYYLTNSRNHSRSADSIQINVPIFEVELTNNSGTKDMTIVCGDERAPKVLLFTENYQFSQPMNIDMRYLVEIAKLNILSDIKYIEKLKSEKRSSTLDKISQSLNISKEQITEDIIKRNITIIDNSNSREYNPINGIDISKIPSRIVSMVPPISDIVWHQEAPYNDQMPIGNIWDGHMGTYQGHYLVGCGNIAVATLFSILKPVMVGETAAGRQILIDWDYLTAQKTITYYSSPDLIEMTASLLRAIYNKTRSFPNYVDFNTYDEDNNPIIKRGIASTSTPTEGMLEYLQTMTTYSGSTGFNNPTVTLMRTTVPENQKIGAMLASKWNQTETDMAILLPEKGVSMIDAEGQPFDGVEERKALFDAIENGIDNGHVEIIKLDCNINDKLFAETAAQKLIDLMEKK